MRNNKLIYFLLCFLFLGFYSCNNEDEIIGDNEDKNIKTISGSEIADIVANMQDTMVYDIDSEEDLDVLCKKNAEIKELELISKGYAKVESEGNLIALHAGVQIHQKKIHPMSTTPIEYSQFKAKFSRKFCDEINVDAVNKISTNKTYVCGWRNAGDFHNLTSNQRGGPQPSPEAALVPSTKSGYSARGYDAYTNANNQFVMVSHQLAIVCEDVNHTTTLLDIRYPFWNQAGYVINYAILTL